MTKAIFIFLASLLILIPILFHYGAIPITTQLIICAPFILFLGIPHGAIDNILYRKNHSVGNTVFITVYLIIIALNVALWYLAPVLAYCMFLTISAYHFGQSQFSHYLSKQAFISKMIYLFWGLTILSGLLFFNTNEILEINNEQPQFAEINTLFSEDFIGLLFLISIISTLGLLIFSKVTNVISLENLLMELLVLGLILTSFYLLPLLIGFTLYFIVLHSYKVISEEFRFLKSEGTVKSTLAFVYLVAPLTLLSFFGIAFLFALIYLNILAMSYGFCLLIVISSITLPHVFVMHQFYDLLFSKKFYQMEK